VPGLTARGLQACTCTRLARALELWSCCSQLLPLPPQSDQFNFKGQASCFAWFNWKWRAVHGSHTALCFVVAIQLEGFGCALQASTCYLAGLLCCADVPAGAVVAILRTLTAASSACSTTLRVHALQEQGTDTIPPLPAGHCRTHC